MSSSVQGVALAMLLSLVPAVAQGFRFDSELTAGYDSNVTNAENKPDIADTAFVRGALSVGTKKRVGRQFLLIAKGSLEGEDFTEFNGLDNIKASATGRVLWQPGSSFTSLTYAFWASAARWEFNSQIRDSNEYRGGVFIARQFTTRLRARIAGIYTDRHSESRVYDTQRVSGLLNVDLLLTPRRTLYGGYQFTTGDTVSTARPNLKVVSAAEVIEPDEVFGGLSTNRQAYRIDHKGHVYTLGLNEALTPKASLDFQVRYATIKGEGGNDYERLQTLISLLKRF